MNQPQELFIVFKCSRAYECGPGYNGYPPSAKAQAEKDAKALTAHNPVGFEALPYVEPSARK